MLPHRVKQRLHQFYIDRSVKQVLNTPPLAAEESSKADFEAHLLLSRRDFLVGLVALKSLLRFDVRASVTVTDDGSLTNAQKSILIDHVPGIRILERFALLDHCRVLEAYPTLKSLYQSEFNMIAKLLHPVLLGRCDSIVAIDADTVFLRRPDKVVHWARGGVESGLYLHDQEARNAEAEWLRRVFAEVLGAPVETFDFKIQHRFFNAGMLCYKRCDCNVASAEKFLSWRKENLARFDQPNASIWLGDWTQEQTAYMFIFGGMKGSVVGLGDEYRLGSEPWSTFHHLLRAGLVTKSAQAKLQDVVCELNTSH